ncbi:DEAD/DEAH box helicase [Myceligenerans pegani]|uniref:DEAD/DEAH box helicase n=1 Tax=Myceligenerans pegani TaxID=2776917 RepID=A0ABR9MT60_9MICO|nr:DEAD/DEAH box helicase [Myceligenerans sp. TRM 65318]MBE1874562.1 DEAD/DEAH box helicase [Myceligenerans sp. TRM 65318]MBE3016833.1 DEAD/DEAH box helicase [Myceligenerans sp. TRM 65318]
MTDPLPAFGPATRAWFTGAFERPTAAQAGAWDAVARGEHALVVAPTGSGKTLAAFLWAIDRLMTTEPPADPARRCRVLYVSPLKALAADVQRNLRSPLAGIRQAAVRERLEVNDVAVGVRTGDTPQAERRAFATRPPDVLITTPESLFLVLTSQARAGLAGVETVIVDEIHAVAGTKRGAHLALSLERLDELLELPAQRIGLSATVRPVDAVARFLGGGRDDSGARAVSVVQPPADKKWDIDVVVPVPDLADLDAIGTPGLDVVGAGAADRYSSDPYSSAADAVGAETVGADADRAGGTSTVDTGGASADSAGGANAAGAGHLSASGPGGIDLTGAATGPLRRASVWPHVEERVVDLVAGHTSTLVFTNSRRGAERLTARMNEVWAQRLGVRLDDPSETWAAAVPGQSGTAAGVTGPPARSAHGPAARAGNGSLSRAGHGPAEPDGGAPGRGMPEAVPGAPEGLSVIARAHHGSMSRNERTQTESELKAGLLPAVVATSSLELGIDMGAVDLVVQVGSPPSVASGLQRIGRAGHQVGAVSKGVIFPMFRGDLVPSTVIAQRMREGEIEHLRVPANPLDVLAQQVVAMLAVDDWYAEDLLAVVRRAAPYTGLGDATWHAVLDMLAGRYPSEDFAELRARITWDRTTGLLQGRRGALRLAATSGGTIPDRGQYGVFLATDDGGGGDGTPRGGKRVGELDEEMVYESRVGDTFTLGSSTWRIEDITPDRVLVSPAPGLPGRLPFWKGDTPGRPAELGRAVGAFVRQADAALAADPGHGRARLREAGLDPWAADNLAAYLVQQREATGRVPDDRTIVVERFRDELGDWRLVIHSPFGARVHAPWSLVVAARLRARFGIDVAAMHSDDGIVLRLPDSGGSWDAWDGGPGPDLRRGTTGAGPDTGDGHDEAPDGFSRHGGDGGVSLENLLIDPDEVFGAVRDELGSSVMFAARFREAAARALLLPRRRPGKRQPLWQQRQRSAQLLQVASEFPEFPIVLEAARECLQDDFDVAALADLMRDAAAGRVRVVETTTESPSPFAQALLVGYTAQFLYDGDAPLAERRAAALSLDPDLLSELLGERSADLADLLDPDAIQRTEAELQGLAPDRQARDAEELWDLLRRTGPHPAGALEARTAPGQRPGVPGWLADLERARRVVRIRLAGRATVPGTRQPDTRLPDTRQPTQQPDAQRSDAEQWAAVEDSGRLRDALGVALPTGVPETFTEPVADPLGDLVRRHARTHGPFTTHDVAARFGIGPAVAAEALARLEAAGRVVRGRLLPDTLGGTGDEWCDPEVLRVLRRRSLAALRAEVEPVEQESLGVFLPGWQGIGAGGLRGTDGLLQVVEQLAGAAVPASALETLVLPARLPDYRPTLLDELTAAGEVLWCGHGRLPGSGGGDGLVSLHLADGAPLTLPASAPVEPDGPLDTALHRVVLDLLTGSGGYFLPRIAELADAEPTAVLEALWDLAWAGLVTNDGLGALRERLGGAGGAHRAPRGPNRARPVRRSRFALHTPAMSPGRPASALSAARTPPGGGGRWSALPARETDPTLRAHALAQVLLDRHGVLTRPAAAAEGVTGGYRDVYRVLSEMEQRGGVRRGYFVEHLGGSQFALPGAVDGLRHDAQDRARRIENGRPAGAVVLAATDPANPYGAALAWPAATTKDGTAESGTTNDATTGHATTAAAHGARAASGAVPATPAVALADGRPARPAGAHRPGRKAGSLVVLVEGSLVLYVERGGRSMLSFDRDPPRLAAAAAGLARAAASGTPGRLVVQRLDGVGAVHAATSGHPVAEALTAAGFAVTPRGLRVAHARG